MKPAALKRFITTRTGALRSGFGIHAAPQRRARPRHEVRSTSDDGIEYVWREEPVPDRMTVTQCYGYLLTDDGRVLIQTRGHGHTNLPGGTPEPGDRDLFDTLAREADEESQVTVTDAAYLGYQEVRHPGREPYAQVRMVGRIGGVRPSQPDPDTGETYGRQMTSLRAVPGILGWGPPAAAQATAAMNIAAATWQLPVNDPAPDGHLGT